MTMNELAAILREYFGDYDRELEEPDESFYADNNWYSWARN